MPIPTHLVPGIYECTMGCTETLRESCQLSPLEPASLPAQGLCLFECVLESRENDLVFNSPYSGPARMLGRDMGRRLFSSGPQVCEELRQLASNATVSVPARNPVGTLTPRVNGWDSETLAWAAIGTIAAVAAVALLFVPFDGPVGEGAAATASLAAFARAGIRFF